MPEPIITEIVHSRDSAMFVWSYGGQKNYTLRAKLKRNGIDNTYSSGRCLFEKWPLEGGVPRPPEFYSRDIRECAARALIWLRFALRGRGRS